MTIGIRSVYKVGILDHMGLPKTEKRQSKTNHAEIRLSIKYHVFIILRYIDAFLLSPFKKTVFLIVVS